MSTVCEFSAIRLRRSTDSTVDDNSTLQFTAAAVADAISPAVNNVRFACTGFASRPLVPGFIEAVFVQVDSKATFRFRPAEPSRFIANGHFVPLGVFSLTARAGGFLRAAGFARFALFGRVVTRVRAESGDTVGSGSRPGSSRCSISRRRGPTSPRRPPAPWPPTSGRCSSAPR